MEPNTDSSRLKPCNECKKVKPWTAFYIRKASPDGLAPICMECKKLKDKENYQKNRIKRIEQATSARKENREKHNEYRRDLDRRKKSGEVFVRKNARNTSQPPPVRPKLPYGPAPKYSEELQAQVAVLRGSGLTFLEIAGKVGCPATVVRYLLAKQGITLTPQQRSDVHPMKLLTDQCVSAICEKRKAGQSIKSICTDVGVRKAAVKRVLAKTGLQIDAEQKRVNVCAGRDLSWQKKLIRHHGVGSFQELMHKYAAGHSGKCLGVYSKSHELLNWECERKHVFSMRPNCVQQGAWCPACVGLGPSKGQMEIYDYVRSLLPPSVEVVVGDRKALGGKELDVYVPSLKFGIEFDGLYYHSSIWGEDKRGRHAAKALLCREKGIKLLAVFEDEWRDKTPLLKSMIRQRLGVFDGTKLNARDLQLVRIPQVGASKAEAARQRQSVNDFFAANHLDGIGAINWVFAYALKHDSKIVCAASFKFNYSGEFELSRLATATGFSVRGGVSRLLDKVRDYDLVTFSNNRLSNGDAYANTGFTLVSEQPPSYWYTDFFSRVWRWRCKRSNDPDILIKYPTEAAQAAAGVFSERLFGHSRPLYRIEDYGHRKWIRCKQQG